MPLFKNNQNIIHRWLLLIVATSQAVNEFHLKKKSCFLRLSPKEFGFVREVIIRFEAPFGQKIIHPSKSFLIGCSNVF